MREVDSSYKNGAKQNIRDVAVKIETNEDSAKTISADKIINVSIQRSLTGGSFSIGNTASDRLNATFVNAEKLPKKTRVTVSAAFNDSPYERIGRFYVDKCTRNGQQVTVTAFDAFSLAETEVKFSGKASKELEQLDFPCTMQELLDYIVTLKGMTCEFECQPFTIHEKPMKSETEYYTARELFGFIAACHGCNAKMDYDGKLTFREFGEVSASLTVDNVLDMTLDDSEPFTVKGVLFTVGDDSIYIDDVAGSEYDEEADGIVKITNPFASVEVAEYVWNKIGNLSYYGGTVKIRGEGIIEPGDVITVKNLKYPTDTTEYPVLITDISYSITRDGGFVETLSSAVSEKSSSSGGGSSSGKSKSSSILDQIKFTAGRAYYNGEEYVLQRGNNRRIIAVSKGTDRCSLIDTEPYGTEAESEISAATAILSGLETRATVEFTFTNNTEGYMISSPARFDDEANVSIDWGDGTTENTLENSHQYPVGTFTVKISAPNATAITSTYTFLGWSNKNDNVMYIGGSVEEVYGNVDYVAKLVFGEGVKRIKGSFGMDNYPLLDFSVPPCVEEIGYLYGRICSNYIYIPSTCISMGSTSGCERLTRVEISPDGSTLEITGYDAFIGGYCNRNTGNPTAVIRHFSLPARCSFTENDPQLCWQNYVRFFRFERGITAIPENLLAHSLDAISRVYIPKTVTSIGYNAMRTRTVVFEGNSGEWDKIEKANADGWGWNTGLECTTILYGEEYYEAFENDIVRDWSELPQDYVAGTGIIISDEKTIGVKLGDGLIIDTNNRITIDKATKNKYGGIKIGRGLKVGEYEQQEDGTWLATDDTDKTLVNLGAGLEFDDNSAVTVTLGSGLEFVEKTAATDDEDATYAIQPKLGAGLVFDGNGAVAVDGSAGGSEYTAGTGVNISSDNQISLAPAGASIGGVKAGEGVNIAADGTISVTGGGADISAGGGIEISTDEDEKTKIAVKCGEGCEINDSGELVTVPNIENAIFISESDAKYLLHEYTQIEYIAGNKIGYAGTENQIIVQGMVVFKQAGTAPNGIALSASSKNYEFLMSDYSLAEAEALIPNPNQYNSFNFTIPAVWYYSDSENYYINSITLEVNEVSTDAISYYCHITKGDGEKTTFGALITNYYNWNGFGVFYQWQKIYPPGYTKGDYTFEFGCVLAAPFSRYRSYNYRSSYYDFYTSAIKSAWYLYIPFASLAEYNAAVGLTYEPLSLTQLSETTTVV